MGLRLEGDMIAQAHQPTCSPPLCVQPGRGAGDNQGRRRHHRRPYGLTTGGSIGATREDAGELRGEDDAIAEAALRCARRDRALPRRPIAMPPTPTSSCKLQHCHGFYGASSMERLPVESALTEQTRRSRAWRSSRGDRQNGWTIRDPERGRAGGARLGAAALAEQPAFHRSEGPDRHQRDSGAGQGPRLSTTIPTRKR
jgi:hypothetical protein